MRLNDESYILTNFEYALERKSIKPFFQPIVRTITGEVCAVETLTEIFRHRSSDDKLLLLS